MREYILYGASKTIVDYTVPRCKALLKKMGKDVKIIYCVDRNEKLWNKQEKIFSPEKIKENPNATIIILASAYKEIVSYLRNEKINNDILAYPYLGYYFPIEEFNEENIQANRDWFFRNEKNIKSIYYLRDKYTSDILAEIAEQKRNLGFVDVHRRIKLLGHLPYFYDEKIAPEGNFTFIDCGACTGDSIEEIYKRFGTKLKKIYALEPDSKNMEQCQERVELLGLQEKCEFMQMGVWSEEKELFFSKDGADFRAVNYETTNKIKVNKLDNIKFHIVGDVALKMDLEGSELEALKGGEEFIKQYTPYMAICLYHKSKDILEIPQYIQSINKKYIFLLRCGSHLECYAVPKERINKASA